MSKLQLTEEQQAAVFNRGGSLLVSAAAGSGKTKVLVERLFSYMEQERCHVDDFLIITYTRAAAAELRGRIAAELSARVAEEPENSHLRKQLFRVYQAEIKTVDAFCGGLLRENIHLLFDERAEFSLTPDFRVLDEQEALLLRQRVLDRTLETFYTRMEEEEDRQAELLAETLGAGRDDRALAALVLDLHQKIQSHPYPLQWLDQVAGSWENLPLKLSDSVYGRAVMADTVRKAEFWADCLERTVREMEGYPELLQAYGDRFLETAGQLRQYRDASRIGWETMGTVRPTFRRMGAVRGDDSRKEQARRVLERCKAALKKINAIYDVSEGEHLEDLYAMAPAMLALIQLTKDFTEAYQKEKLRRNVVDFSDQEHYAIEILMDGAGNPTELAEQVASRYREVMVDEYQDSNEVQNCIFRAVSHGEKNLFAVGDVKQSIYRFRLADPTIFLEKYLSYCDYDTAQEDQPRRVLLSRNFRSRSQILSAANFIFTNIMSQEMGEMVYGEEEQLNFGATYYLPRKDVDAELHLISVEDTEEESFDRLQVEARFVAGQIRKLLDQNYPVQEADGTMRPVRPEDIVILMRAPRSRLAAFTAALQRENIPCSSREEDAFFDTMEIAVIFSFLQIIDNPRQDVPLIAVLRSPLFAFTPDRLAQIRAARTDSDFYDALCSTEGEDITHFREVLQNLREASREMPAAELIWELYQQCHVLGIFGAMEDGAQRKEHLMALYTYAANWSGEPGIFGLVTHLRNLLENDRQPAMASAQVGGGVQIMSIHKSKGLEFPVVILADLQKSFNSQDMVPPVLVHPKMGLGTERVDLERQIRYNSISKTAISMELEREAKAEEMRILYVAMTRAREKLIAVNCMSHARKHVQDLAAITDLPVPPEAVSSSRCLGDWLLLPLLCTDEAAQIRMWADLEYAEPEAAPGWKLRLWTNPTGQEEKSHEAGQVKREESSASREIPFDPQQLEYVYPYGQASSAPSKLTATQLKGRALDQELEEHKVDFRDQPFEKPKFLQKDRALDAAQRGTAMHLVMQYLPFDTEPTQEALQEVVAGLVGRHLLTGQQAECVDCGKLAAFLISPLAQRLRNAARVLREYRFALLLDAEKYLPQIRGEQMLLQGVVDCCFETEQGLVIVDFKTDRIAPHQVQERAEHYRPQLEAYSDALSRVLEKPVAEKILYFFATGQEISLE
ncbi:MAG: helicase-exonuclease AddAB subunit AddA [Ruminococcaceae bacterium]|nr:helicase-exonuclease AddAB subunit AddA [Oscillospiraceae bacterium]